MKILQLQVYNGKNSLESVWMAQGQCWISVLNLLQKWKNTQIKEALWLVTRSTERFTCSPRNVIWTQFCSRQLILLRAMLSASVCFQLSAHVNYASWPLHTESDSCELVMLLTEQKSALTDYFRDDTWVVKLCYFLIWFWMN